MSGSGRQSLLSQRRTVRHGLRRLERSLTCAPNHVLAYTRAARRIAWLCKQGFVPEARALRPVSAG